MTPEENQPLEQHDPETPPKRPRNTLSKTHLLILVVAALSFLGGYLGRNFQATTGAVSDTQAVAGAPATQTASSLEPTVIRTDDDPSIGPADAPITIVEFSDYQCPFCKRFRDQTLNTLLDAYPGQIRFVYRDFPLSNIHPRAQIAAEVANCAGDQGRYWEMHDRLFANQSSWAGAKNGMTYFVRFADDLALDLNAFGSCIKTGKYAEEVQKDVQDGIAYGVSGTPSFFVNGKFISGAVPFQMFQAVIERQLFDVSGGSSK